MSSEFDKSLILIKLKNQKLWSKVLKTVIYETFLLKMCKIIINYKSFILEIQLSTEVHRTNDNIIEFDVAFVLDGTMTLHITLL